MGWIGCEEEKSVDEEIEIVDGARGEVKVVSSDNMMLLFEVS